MHFINSAETSLFESATRDLLAAPLVGLDSEFTNTYTKLDPPGQIATLQLSTESQVYIFDVLALRRCPSFISFVSSLFCSSSVTKLGHSLSADVA